MSESGIPLWCKGSMSLMTALGGLFLIGQLFFPQINGGLFAFIPVIGPYVPGLLGAWAVSIAIGYRTRPIAIVDVHQVERIGPVLGMPTITEGVVTVVDKTLLVDGKTVGVARFLIKDEDWAAMEAYLSDAARQG